VLSHVLLQVEFDILEDKVELVLGVDDLDQLNDVWVFEAFK